jgi:hypothetical protein
VKIVEIWARLVVNIGKGVFAKLAIRREIKVKVKKC